MMVNSSFHHSPLLDYPKIVSMICSHANTWTLLGLWEWGSCQIPCFQKIRSFRYDLLPKFRVALV